MTAENRSHVAKVILNDEGTLLDEWLKHQSTSRSRRGDLISEDDLRGHSRVLFEQFKLAARSDLPEDIGRREWEGVREHLGDLSRSWARLGLSPSETATFVLSFKQVLFARLRDALGGSPAELGDALWEATLLLDKLALYTTDISLQSRQDIISRQHDELLELSTPVVQLWDGILVLPLIGALDSKRTQSVMENLLQRIVDTGSEVAIVDITGVPTVDTLTAQHLLKTITATRLMGAECIISGIRPQIAQTIVHLGVDLGDVMTRSSMAGALKLALERRELTIVKRSSLRPKQA